MSLPNFQAAASEQGRWWEKTCTDALRYAGFTIVAERITFPECGIEADIVADNKHGIRFYISCKGSMQGDRPGMVRTDTLKKAIAEMALLSVCGYWPLVVMASHSPIQGTGVAMLAVAQRAWPFQVINPITDSKHLRWLAQANEDKLRAKFGDGPNPNR